MNRSKKAIIILAIGLLLAGLSPFGAGAAPAMKAKEGVKIFHGKWISDRYVPNWGYVHQELKIRCDQETNYCKMRMVMENNRTCVQTFGEGIKGLNIDEGYVEILDNTIGFYSVDAYCLTSPRTYMFPVPFPFEYTYNMADDTLIDSIGTVWYRK